MSKQRRSILSMMAAVVFAVALCPGVVYADEAPDAALVASGGLTTQDGNIASGTWGTCPWEISADGVLTVHPGTGADTGEKSPWSDYAEQIKAVVFSSENDGKVVAPAKSSRLLSELSHAQSVDLTGLDTSNVKTMDQMFLLCSSLTALDLSGLDTSNVETMVQLFGVCSSLNSLNLSGIDTSNVNDMSKMCYFCTGLSSLDISGFNTAKVQRMDDMFAGCSLLETFDLSGLDTSSLERVDGLFNDCKSLSSINLSGFDTSKVGNMRGMFSGCSSLASLDLSGFNTSKVGNMRGMFSGCSSLASLDLSGFDTSNVITMQGVFSYCSSLTTIKVGEKWTVEGTYGHESYSRDMFLGCTSLVGGNGTAYDENHVDAEYARVDAEDAPGYFTKAPVKKSLADAVVTLSPASFTYDGKAKEPLVTVKLGDAVLKSGEDYAVAYKDNANVGIATVTVAGKGAYTGSKTATFSIVAAEHGGGSGGSGDPEPTPAKPDLKQYEGAAAASGMSDLKPGEWFMDPATGAFPETDTLYLDYTIARGLMGGYAGDRAGQFGPHDTLSRAQTATILYRLANPGSKATTDPAAYEDNGSGLPDVASKQYYTAAVNWCVEQGVITGYRDAAGRYYAFGPDDAVAREQLATMIFRYCTLYAGRDADAADITAFSDYSKISDWARAGVAYCAANRIVGGYTDGSGRFGPQDSAERCQMAKIIAVTAYMLE